mmetsp:Transcript_65759/g.140685  ORF Transcript_65759/g.140685 Transcript_65759/m.140685 type:complete len:342 (-) Transcript_65759:1844-2869(-)
MLEEVADEEQRQLSVFGVDPRLEQSRGHLRVGRKSIRCCYEEIGVMLHDGPDDLVEPHTKPLLVLVLLPIQVQIAILVSSNCGHTLDVILGALLSSLQGLGQEGHGDLAEVVHLVGTEDAWPCPLQASCDAVCPRLQGLQVYLCCLKLGKDPLEELHDEVTDNLHLPPIPGASAEQTPRLKSEVPNFLCHRKLEDGQESCGRLSNKWDIRFSKLINEGMYGFQGALQILYLRRIHDENLHLPILLCQSQIDLAVLVEALMLFLIEFPRCERELLEHAWQDVRQKWQEVLLHRRADSLRRRHHVLLDRVAARHVGSLGCFDHGLHNDLGIGAETILANRLRE